MRPEVFMSKKLRVASIWAVLSQKQKITALTLNTDTLNFAKKAKLIVQNRHKSKLHNNEKF